jgi:hypothetical protein
MRCSPRQAVSGRPVRDHGAAESQIDGIEHVHKRHPKHQTMVTGALLLVRTPSSQCPPCMTYHYTRGNGRYRARAHGEYGKHRLLQFAVHRGRHRIRQWRRSSRNYDKFDSCKNHKRESVFPPNIARNRVE